MHVGIEVQFDVRPVLGMRINCTARTRPPGVTAGSAFIVVPRAIVRDARPKSGVLIDDILPTRVDLTQ